MKEEIQNLQLIFEMIILATQKHKSIILNHYNENICPT